MVRDFFRSGRVIHVLRLDVLTSIRLNNSSPTSIRPTRAILEGFPKVPKIYWVLPHTNNAWIYIIYIYTYIRQVIYNPPMLLTFLLQIEGLKILDPNRLVFFAWFPVSSARFIGGFYQKEVIIRMVSWSPQISKKKYIFPQNRGYPICLWGFLDTRIFFQPDLSLPISMIRKCWIFETGWVGSSHIQGCH